MTGDIDDTGEAEDTDALTVIELEGDLDLADAPRLQQVIEARIDSGSGPVEISLRGVRFVDSTGLRLVMQAAKACQRAGRPFRLTNVGDQPLRLLRLVGLEGLLAADPPDNDSEPDIDPYDWSPE